MPVEDAEMTRSVRREISRRYVDTNNVDVRVIHGIVYLRGWIDRLRGYESMSLVEELEIILRILRGRPGVRDVVCEVELGRPGLRESVKASQKKR
jgi:hypothetical protein